MPAAIYLRVLKILLALPLRNELESEGGGLFAEVNGNHAQAMKFPYFLHIVRLLYSQYIQSAE